MTTSIIVATKNRSRELSQLLLPSLLSQTRLPDQIVLVDQSSDDCTKELLEGFVGALAASGRSKPEFLYLYEPNAIGAGAARNAGIERAEGDIVVFLDDDVLLEPDFLQELLAVYQRDPQVGGVSGVITNYLHPPFLQWMMRTLFWIGPFHDERQPIYWNADRLRDRKPVRVRKFGSGLMSVRRSVLDGDRFDGRYKGAGGEDVDLSWRLSERCRLVMTPRARLLHARSETGRPREHWLSSEALGNYYLYHRIWKSGIKNCLCFAWLNVGYALLATLGSLRRLSLDPWRSLLRGIQLGREQGGR